MVTLTLQAEGQEDPALHMSWDNVLGEAQRCRDSEAEENSASGWRELGTREGRQGDGRARPGLEGWASCLYCVTGLP